MLNAFIDRIVVHEADKSSGERVQDIDVHFSFIGKFSPPHEEHIPTEEELAEAEKRRAKLAKQREANRRWYAKKRAEQTGEIPEPTPEELAAAARTAQIKREERAAKNREHKREWARQDRAKKSAVTVTV